MVPKNGKKLNNNEAKASESNKKRLKRNEQRVLNFNGEVECLWDGYKYVKCFRKA